MKTVINFKDIDTFCKLERQVYDGTIDVSDFPPAEYKYFSELRKIYYAFKFEGLAKSDAEKQKSVLLCHYHEDLQEHKNRLEVYRHYQENIRQSEMICTAIQKSNDITEIALLACKAVSLMTGEPTFAKLQERKITETMKGDTYDSNRNS
ncbi:MAG: hypothetical protein NC485_08390 [Ruminococcus flavefaciens]|nr:hypothetical protein [Ruminococcus flavefaciens]MCM1062720.1 hypothetical protein [Eubacterium sp.]